MKKNFFKKLSFVIALAMIVSVVAPAAGAFAAAAAKLNATKKYLVLGDDFDFNVINGQKGWKYKYTSSKTSVATVTAGTGIITTKAIGTTTITLKASKAGKVVKTLKATVIVKDPMTSITLTNKPEKELKVGEANDFGRTFKTVSGSTKKTSTITRYAVDSDKAEINPVTGIFTAKEAGEYNVKVLGFQTVAQYNAWVAAKDFASTKSVVVSDTAKVTVVPSIVKTEQVDKDTIKVTFDSDMSKSTLAKDGLLYQVIANKDVTTGAEKIKEVKFDETGKVATIDAFAAFNQKADYKYVYGNLVGTFKSASRTLADVKTISFPDFDADITKAAGTDLREKVVALDVNGVEILDGKEIDALNASVLTFAFDTTGDMSKAFVSGYYLFNHTLGYPAPVTVTFNNYVYDETTKQYSPVKLTDSAVGTGSKTDASVDGSTISYVVNQNAATPSDTAAWGSKFSVAANDGRFFIHAKYKTKDANKSSDSYKKTDDNTVFTYMSQDADKLLVSGFTLVPVAPGVATVLVYVDKTVVGTFEVNIVAGRTFAAISQDTAYINIGNAAAPAGETGKIKVTLKDSLTDNIKTGASFGAIVVNNYPANGNTPTNLANISVVPGTPDSDGVYTLSVTAPGVIPGAYSIKIPVTVSLNGTAKTLDMYFTMVVGDADDVNGNNPASKVITRYGASISDTSMNMKDVLGAAAPVAQKVTVDVYGYNSAGYRVVKVDNDDYRFEVTFENAAFTTADVTTEDHPTVPTGVTPSTTLDELAVVKGTTSLTNIKTGTYFIKVIAVNKLTNNAATPVDLVLANNPIGQFSFTLNDTTSAVASVKSATVPASTANLADAVFAAFKLTINDKEISAATAIKSVTYSDGTSALTTDAAPTTPSTLTAGRTIYVEKVVVTVTLENSVTYDYTINVKNNFRVN